MKEVDEGVCGFFHGNPIRGIESRIIPGLIVKSLKRIPSGELKVFVIIIALVALGYESHQGN